MKIIETHATLFLLEKLHAIHNFHSSYRAIHLKMNGKQARYNRSMKTHFIMKSFRQLLSADEGHVYVCDDGDIIILFQGRMTPLIRKLARHFADIDAEHATSTLDHYFDTYDLSKDWARFANMCHIKSIESDLWNSRIKNLPAAPRPWEAAPVP